MVQNKALCLITGTHMASAVEHLHEGTQILPVAQHLLASQHLAKTLQPSHPSFDLVTSTNATATRGKKSTLRSSCWSTVAPFLTNGTVPLGKLKNVLSKIHTKIVEDLINGLGTNKVLQAHVCRRPKWPRGHVTSAGRDRDAIIISSVFFLSKHDKQLL